MATILIVDDEIANAELVKVYLESDGHHVYIAYTGMEGYDIAQQVHMDLIFLDLRMPEYSWTGYTTATELKANVVTQDIPLVALTAAGDITRAMQAGCDDALKRPFKHNQLRAILTQHLGSIC